MRKIIFFIWIIPIFSFAQVDHWESVILEGDTWKYLVPDSQLEEEWISLDYDDKSWEEGPSGFGYGDDDDNVLLESVQSVFLRKKFNITDLNAIKDIIFNIDYDDSYLAYLNGIEISRRYLIGDPPPYNQRSEGWHEALLYQGLKPENIKIDPGILVEGENILAIQVHNESTNSSDLTAIPFLSVGITNESNDYRPTPPWFQSPLVFTSSHLPIIKINTNGQHIWDEPKTNAEIGIIYNGEGNMNNVNDPFNEYFGHCGIEIRGESSQIFDKKSYLFEFWDEEGNDMDTSFLNFPSEEDFILYGPYMDKSMINNVLAMKIGRDMGQYTSRTRFVELLINDEYRGLYVVMEKIKRDKNRLDIAKLNPEEISGDDLTGGYIVRLDKGIYQGWDSKFNASGTNEKIFFQYYVPDQDEIREEQKTYIQTYFHQFEQALASFDYTNDQNKRYTDYINVRSFVDNFIINELSKNVDAYRLSTYLHKDKDSKGGKIVAGPLWDFNLSFGNADYCGGDDNIGWIYQQCDHGGIPFWWQKFVQDEFFKNALRCRWESLRQNELATDNIHGYIDSMVLEIGEAADRNFEKWPVLGIYVWPNPWYFSQPTEYEDIINTVKNRLTNRLQWLDLNIPGVAENCAFYDEFDNMSTSTVDHYDDQERVQIYPNPSTSLIHIESENRIFGIEVFDILGNKLYTEKPNSNSTVVNLSSIVSPGSYLIRLQDEQGFVNKVILHQ